MIDYSSERGLGSLIAVDSSGVEGPRYDFHCTTIADGSREVAEGAEVMFTVGAVGPGVWEAIGVHTLPAL